MECADGVVMAVCCDKEKWLGQVLYMVGNYRILHIVVITSKYLLIGCNSNS